MATYSSPGVYVQEVASGSAPIAGVGTSTPGFIGRFGDSVVVATSGSDVTFSPVKKNEIKLVTNFTEFKDSFGDFSKDEGQIRLAHGVYGFFKNGGTRCYVSRVGTSDDLSAVLSQFEAIDEISMVLAPGITDKTSQKSIIDHCELLQNRVAILDAPESTEKTDSTTGSKTYHPVFPEPQGTSVLPGNSSYAAYYYPWIQVYDPATKAAHPEGDGLRYVPPSGHMAGLFARVDQQRGVHKAPANEVVYGAVGLRWNVSKAIQDGLNPDGINVIRNLNGNIRVWGARTLGGDANGEFKYINVRRLFCFLRDSIDRGLQWSVFEPNDLGLWAKIRRNLSAFLGTVWESGALFGATSAEAFYVKCDEETNPPAQRDLGQVTTEIGVAITRPAEFVIFKLGQWTASAK